jgi:tetratricopeptide (TPR) repeat protein
MVAALAAYETTLDGAIDDGSSLLPALLARDGVEAVLNKTERLPADQAAHLVALDQRLRKDARGPALEALHAWRGTLHPPEAHWWWFLDRAAEQQEEEKDLPWAIGSGVLMTLTVPLAIEIIRRLWAGAPDVVSAFGTLLTLLLTSSPLTKRGRELAQWLLHRIPRLQRRFHAETMFVMGALAFVLVLVVRLLLPQLAIVYNNLGHDAIRAGNLTLGQRHFQRAVALDPDLAVGYYHLGVVYDEIGRPEDAIAWYQRALEHDLTLGAAYNNLGRLYILQGDLEQAVQVLYAGLRYTPGTTQTERVTRYRLLSNLGRAYYLLEQPTIARDVLEQALALEDGLDAALKSAVPHHYLARSYEALGLVEAARQEWEESLRYVNADDPDQTGWADVARARLEEETP